MRTWVVLLALVAGTAFSCSSAELQEPIEPEDLAVEIEAEAEAESAVPADDSVLDEPPPGAADEVDSESAVDAWEPVDVPSEYYGVFRTLAEDYTDPVVWAPEAVPPGFQRTEIEFRFNYLKVVYENGPARISYHTQANPEYNEPDGRVPWADGETADISVRRPGTVGIGWRQDSLGTYGALESIIFAEGVEEAAVREAALRMRRVQPGSS